MAKYKVVKLYADKNTKVLMEPGAVVEYDDARAKELKGYIEKVANKAVKKPDDK